MAQPIWQTPAGTLGSIPEGIFYQVLIQAIDPDGGNVFYQLIAGQLPAGIQLTINGIVEGTPQSIVTVQGVPTEVAEDVVSKFTVRAYTTEIVSGQEQVSRINDRTFTITVTGQDVPDFVTSAGSIGSFNDGTRAEFQIEFTDTDPGDTVTARIIGGELPPGLSLNSNGLISGIILPLSFLSSVQAGYDLTEFDLFSFDFQALGASRNFEFTVEITDGKQSNVRTFSMFVNAQGSASSVFEYTPVLLTAPGAIGTTRTNNFYIFRFTSIDFNNDTVEYVLTTVPGLSIPPGLQFDSATGQLYGYISDQGAVENSYRFGVQVRKVNNPSIISDIEYFTLSTISSIESQVRWITADDLGIINNGEISTLGVEAVATDNLSLLYKIADSTGSRLPPGVSLSATGNLIGRVSFNTFCIDGGTTTFDIGSRTVAEETTFDETYTFTVNAYSPSTENPTFRVSRVNIAGGGSDYTGNPTVTFSAPPDVEGAVTATVGSVTVVGGVITEIVVDNPGSGYRQAPNIVITDSTGSGAEVSAVVEIEDVDNVISIFRTFTLRVSREFNTPYETLYIKAMPPHEDRALVKRLIQNQDIIPDRDLYRADDPNFGIAKNVRYNHAYGLTASNLQDYVDALEKNHYWKNLVLGAIEYAVARDAAGNIIYEVVYSRIVDDLLNNQGDSVAKSLQLPRAVHDAAGVDTVYPNSLINMRDQVIDSIGHTGSVLPAWMTSKQEDGTVLGFIPVWAIAYVRPGLGAKTVYNIQQQFGNQLNRVDFRADRYEIDRSASFAWESYDDSSLLGQWQPYPPETTIFDSGNTIFDQNSTRFITPANTVINTDSRDKYVVFPKINILG